MVEQAVQTVPAEKAVQKKGLSGVQPQGGETGRAQRARAPAQRGELPKQSNHGQIPADQPKQGSFNARRSSDMFSAKLLYLMV